MEALSDIVFERTLSRASAAKLSDEQLSRRLRTLLLTVDGQSPVSSFVPFLKALAPLSEKFSELEQLGFVRRVGSDAPPPNERSAYLPEKVAGTLAMPAEIERKDPALSPPLNHNLMGMDTISPALLARPADIEFERQLQELALQMSRLPSQ